VLVVLFDDVAVALEHATGQRDPIERHLTGRFAVQSIQRECANQRSLPNKKRKMLCISMRELHRRWGFARLWNRTLPAPDGPMTARTRPHLHVPDTSRKMYFSLPFVPTTKFTFLNRKMEDSIPAAWLECVRL
jgi:hypothetical protein